MQVQLRQKRSERGPRRGRHGTAKAAAVAVDLARHPSESAVERLRRPAQQPLTGDSALYSCQCGFQFEATVSTSVGCPHCGDTQAW